MLTVFTGYLKLHVAYLTLKIMWSAGKISESERIFITHGADLNFRSDGRTCLDYRPVMIEQSVIETCSGSAHARTNNTDVLVGIKLELETVSDLDDWQGCGRVQVFADISAIASPAFEGRKGEDITCQLEALYSEILPNHIDLEKLVIVPNKSYFVLHVDIVILECSSLASLIDITSIAIKVALHDVKIPKINILSAEYNEFNVSEDEFESSGLDVSRVPLVTAYTKIGTKFVVDATWEEEQASVGTVALAFLPPDQVVLIKKIGIGSISTDSLHTLYQIATEFACQLAHKLDEKMCQDNLKNQGKVTFSLN